MPGSVLAHGTIDNVLVKTPPPPVQAFTGVFENGTWAVSFLSLLGWSYSLESSTDLRQWTGGPNRVSGTSDLLKISLMTPSDQRRFFRINAAPQE